MSGETDVLDEVPPELVRRVEAALTEDRTDDVRSLLADLSATGQASIIEQLSDDERDKLVEILKSDLDPETLLELVEGVRESVLDHLNSKDIAAAARELETDDAAFIIDELEADERAEVLAELPADERAEIESALAYPDGTAGRLMQRSLVRIPDGWTVGEVIDHCREATDLPDDVYDIFVVDSGGRLRGSVPLGRMLRTKRPVPILDIVDPDIPSVPATAEQDEVAHLFRDKNLVSCPVIDEIGRLQGVIMVDDVVDVIDEEAEADLLKMAGVDHDDMHASPVRTARLRAVWLTINLATAVLASAVIGQFDI